MTPRVRIAALAGALIVAAASIGDAGGDAIRARVHVVRASEPGQLEVYVSVSPAAANRGYTVTANCRGEDVQRSYRQLEGAESQGPFDPVVWRNLPGCRYTIAAALLGADGRRLASAQVQYARILCFSCDDDEDQP